MDFFCFSFVGLIIVSFLAGECFSRDLFIFLYFFNQKEGWLDKVSDGQTWWFQFDPWNTYKCERKEWNPHACCAVHINSNTYMHTHMQTHISNKLFKFINILYIIFYNSNYVLIDFWILQSITKTLKCSHKLWKKKIRSNCNFKWGD